MPQLAIIADDITGAADTAAPFAKAGFVTLFVCGSGSLPAADVLTLSTESRHLPPEQAKNEVQQAARRVRAAGWIYKKIDSTLRGSPATELIALMDTLHLSHALVAPAFPTQGRTTILGRQLVGGVPLEQSVFARDIQTSDLRELFSHSLVSDSPSRPVRLIDLNTVRQGIDAILPILAKPGIIVADAETDADLCTLAEASIACGLRLFCGSAGLAYALVHVLPMLPTVPAFVLPQPVHGPILVVAGSRNVRTQRQVEVAAARGATVITPKFDAVGSQVDLIGTAEAVKESLACGRPTILTTATIPVSPLGSQAIAHMLGNIVCMVVQHISPGVLIVTGGDIATSVMKALSATCLWLQGEIQSGIPWGILVDGLLPGVKVVTKSGGFGTEDVLAHIISMGPEAF